MYIVILHFCCFCSSSNLLSYYGAVEHPNSPSLSSPSSTPKLVSGGSSGGSAVAVATGMCDL